ncbi:MAG: hypothetical protein J5U19_15990 [Candidatus Methanoperedens sp.]|nr:hypothetical protein [Candidatus Methanoperedens sp.]
MSIIVRVYAPVHPTEIGDKVKAAIANIIPVGLHNQDSGTPGVCGEGDIESLRKLHRFLRDAQILDTARNYLISGIDGNMTRFRLNKQVAYVGKVNFPAGEESLGSIYVEISAIDHEELLKIIDWLAPETVDGEPVMEIEL